MMEASEVHISSMVVHVRPEGMPSVKANIEKLSGAEIHGESERGKIVVVLESLSEAQITDTISKINDLAHVIGTALVYQQVLPLEIEEKNPI